MSRNFVRITVKELKEKIEAHSEDDGKYLDYRRLTPTVEKDLDKVQFDTENIAILGGRNDKDFLGYHTLPNKMSYLGVYAGGDWENPVFFIIYWDGQKLRGYIPEDGNLYNTTTKQAYGNNEEADLKNARKRWPDDKELQKATKDNFDVSYLDNYDFKAMKDDIMARIIEKPLTKVAKSSKVRAGGSLLLYSDEELLAELKRRMENKNGK
jgi:hypothetical protein